VVDLRLGDESGLDVVKGLLELDPKLKIVVLTAYGTIATALEAVRLGAVNYLTKPIEVEQILASFEGRAPSTKELAAIPTPEQVEWDYINRAVRDHDGNVSRAAQALGLHRRSLQRKLRKPPHVR
jgi:two-component system response regulator RegA